MGKINLLKKYKAKSIFIKLIVSFVCTSALSVILLSFLLFFFFRQSSMGDINTMTKLVLSNICNKVTGVFDSSQNIAYQIYKNPNVKDMMFSYDKSIFNTVDVSYYIGDIMNSNPYISSVYIFNGKSIVFKKSNLQQLNEDDGTIQNIILNNQNLTVFPRQAEMTDGKAVDLYTIYFAETNSKNTVDSAVVVNLDANALYKDIFTESINGLQNVLITDNSGKVILHSNMDFFLKDEGNEPFMQDIIGSVSTSGSISINDNSSRLVVNFIRSQKKQYIAVTMSDYNYFVRQLSKARNIVVVSCLVILAIIIFVAYLTSNRLYNPINNIFSNIKSFFSLTSENTIGSNDFQYISQAVSRVIERINMLEKDKEDNFSLQKNNFMKNLLAASSPVAPEILMENLWKYKFFDSCDKPYGIIVIRLDNFKDFYNNNTMEAIDFQLDSIGNLACEMLDVKTKCTSFEISPSHTVLLISFNETDKSWFFGNIQSIMKRIQDTVLQLFKLSVTIGISECSNSVEEIRLLYKQAYELTNYRLIFGKKSIFDKNSIFFEDINYVSIDQHIDFAVNAVKKGSKEHYEASLQTLLEKCRHLEFEDIVKIFCRIADSIMKIPVALETRSSAAKRINYEEICETVKNFEDDSELLEWLRELYEYAFSMLESINNRSAFDVMKNAIDYINSNYNDPFISANIIADKFSITPQYFSKIFNEITRSSFPEYLSNIRLEKAKEMLLNNPKLGISDIYEKVGYSSRNYFTTAFKNKYGVSPSKIKETQKIQA